MPSVSLDQIEEWCKKLSKTLSKPTLSKTLSKPTHLVIRRPYIESCRNINEICCFTCVQLHDWLVSMNVINEDEFMTKLKLAKLVLKKLKEESDSDTD